MTLIWFGAVRRLFVGWLPLHAAGAKSAHHRRRSSDGARRGWRENDTPGPMTYLSTAETQKNH